MQITKLVQAFLFCNIVVCSACNGNQSAAKQDVKNGSDSTVKPVVQKPVIDTADYLNKIQLLANKDTTGRWPVRNQPYPLPGAILPFNRVIAYYGNLYSKKMGVLGEYPRDVMLKMLQQEVAKWQKADSNFKVIPALHYICVTAQGAEGADKKYRYRMPHHQIDTIINWAKKIDALVFIDIQVGLSTLQQELPVLEKYLSMPNVHLGIDPEFSMKGGQKPGTVIGSFDAADINYAITYLQQLVQKNNIPPKVLVIHRFTRDMVKDYKQIKLVPEVQNVIDMDGWGEAPRKVNTYRLFVQSEPVQFTGFKIFYKNDTKRVNKPKEMQPEELLKLRPVPIYIQYQ